MTEEQLRMPDKDVFTDGPAPVKLGSEIQVVYGTEKRGGKLRRYVSILDEGVPFLVIQDSKKGRDFIARLVIAAQQGVSWLEMPPDGASR